MLVWINGTFGVGKTTTAKALMSRLPGHRLFDPEWVGFMLHIETYTFARRWMRASADVVVDLTARAPDDVAAAIQGALA